MDTTGRTLESLAKEIGVSRERVRQIIRPTPKRFVLGFVYAVQVENFVKLGITKDIQEKMYYFDGAYPFKVTLLGTLPGSRIVERQLHQQFLAFHHKREWFHAHPTLLAWIDRHMALPPPAAPIELVDPNQ